MASMASGLPRWDMSSIYHGLDSPGYLEAVDRLELDLDQISTGIETHTICDRKPSPLDAEAIRAFEDLLVRYDTALDRIHTLRNYVGAFELTDSRADLPRRARSELQPHEVRLAQLGARLTAWVGGLDVESLIERSEVARGCAFALRRMSTQAQHLMTPAEEDLAAELDVTAGLAWQTLRDGLTSRITVALELDGAERTVPVAEAENIASLHPDRVLRRQAHEGIILAFEGAALPLASALNSIKGQRIALSRRRGWGSPLEQALFENQIDRGILDAMLEAVRESYPEFRRYLRAKAQLMGLPVLAWYDFIAPVGSSGRTWEYEEATAFIIERFGRYSGRLGELARRAFEEHWIDAEPREGKAGGALCMWLRAGESRILVNYSPSFLQVSTLAHELGHAYHNHSLANLGPLRRSTPMTLAETASTFCETLVRHAGMEDADAEEQIQVLGAFLSTATSLIAHTSAAFLAERRLFERREERELSVEEFNALVSTSLGETFGDSIDANTVNPFWVWAYLPHLYWEDFYNFQYAFGLLFGLGLYSRYQENPAEFVRGYDALLADTGQSDVASLASRFGIDIGQLEFWRSSLEIIRADIDRFEGLVSRRSTEASRSTTTPAQE